MCLRIPVCELVQSDLFYRYMPWHPMDICPKPTASFCLSPPPPPRRCGLLLGTGRRPAAEDGVPPFLQIPPHTYCYVSKETYYSVKRDLLLARSPAPYSPFRWRAHSLSLSHTALTNTLSCTHAHMHTLCRCFSHMQAVLSGAAVISDAGADVESLRGFSA